MFRKLLNLDGNYTCTVHVLFVCQVASWFWHFVFLLAQPVATYYELISFPCYMLQVLDWQSIHQSQTIPIPSFPPVDSSVNFIGRLAREILRITDTRSTTFIEQMSAWYDKRTNQEVVNLRLWEQLQVHVHVYCRAASYLELALHSVTLSVVCG